MELQLPYVYRCQKWLDQCAYAQIDHTTGLLILREHRQPLSIWCTAAVKEDLSEGNPLFKVLGHYSGIDWHELTTDQAVSHAHTYQQHQSDTRRRQRGAFGAGPPRH